MSAVPEIYDERRPDAESQLHHRLAFPIERITARDLPHRGGRRHP
jgi:hypothetical protein